jgi:hypothetical protein
MEGFEYFNKGYRNGNCQLLQLGVIELEEVEEEQ